MILEVADIRIAPGRQAEFERAVHHGIQTVTPKSKGFRGYPIRYSIESPERYLLLLECGTLKAIPLASAARLPSHNDEASWSTSSSSRRSSSTSRRYPTSLNPDA